MEDEAYELGDPNCVIVEFIGTQVFSSLDKALEFVEKHGVSPELINVHEMYFTPMGTAAREVIIQEE